MEAFPSPICNLMTLCHYFDLIYRTLCTSICPRSLSFSVAVSLFVCLFAQNGLKVLFHSVLKSFWGSALARAKLEAPSPPPPTLPLLTCPLAEARPPHTLSAHARKCHNMTQRCKSFHSTHQKKKE